MAGFPQIYILDPDRHIIEINADKIGDELSSNQPGE